MITVDVVFTCDNCGRKRKKNTTVGDPEDLNDTQFFYPDENMTYAEDKIFCSQECYRKYLLKHGRKKDYEALQHGEPFA